MEVGKLPLDILCNGHMAPKAQYLTTRKDHNGVWCDVLG